MNERKTEQLKEITPLLWNSYQHMYDVRRVGIQNRTNFLLLIISFLSVISITLFIYFNNVVFISVFLLQLVSFVVLLKVFFIKNFKHHWFESKSIFNNLNKNDFYQDLFADLKALEEDTWIFMEYVRKVTNKSIYLLLLSLYILLLILIFIYFKGIILCLSILILTIICVPIVYFYYRKQPNFKYELNYKKYKKQIDEWVKR